MYTQGIMSATSCCIKSSTSKGPVFLFILTLFQRQTECCAACLLADSLLAVTFDARGMVGVASGRGTGRADIAVGAFGGNE